MGFFNDLTSILGGDASQKRFNDSESGVGPGMSDSDREARDECDARDRAAAKAKRIKYLGEAMDDLDEDDEDDDDD